MSNTSHIKYLRRSGQILASALQLSLSMIESGCVVIDIEKEVVKFLSAHKAQPSFYGLDGYKFATCVSVNEQVVHSEPTLRVLQNGDIVTVDIGVRYKGWCTDAARTVTVGGGTPVTSVFITTANKALDEGIWQCYVGNSIGDISYAIQRIVETRGFKSPVELGGHGIGRKPHSKPFIPNYGRRGTGVVIKEGMCLAIEPIVMKTSNKLLFGSTAIYSADGGISAHAEDTVYIAKGGPIILTRETLQGDII